MAQYFIGRFSRRLEVCTIDCNCFHYVFLATVLFFVGGRNLCAKVFNAQFSQSAKIWYLVVLFCLLLVSHVFEISLGGGFDHEEGWIQIQWRRINDQNPRW